MLHYQSNINGSSVNGEWSSDLQGKNNVQSDKMGKPNTRTKLHKFSKSVTTSCI